MSRFIVTNDDGVLAPGIMALVEALRPLGTVQVVAPASNQSASGHKKTLFRDIEVEEVTMADGTPATARRPIVSPSAVWVCANGHRSWWYPASTAAPTWARMSRIAAR